MFEKLEAHFNSKLNDGGKRIYDFLTKLSNEFNSKFGNHSKVVITTNLYHLLINDRNVLVISVKNVGFQMTTNYEIFDFITIAEMERKILLMLDDENSPLFLIIKNILENGIHIL